MLEVQNITKIYNPGTVMEHRLFHDFSLTVDEGQFVAIVGGNGSGKTSLLNIICGTIPLESGDVRIDGQSIAKRKDYQRYANMGRVYQNPSAGVCPNLTMLENLSLADNKGKPFNLTRAVNRSRVDFYRDQLRALDLGLAMQKLNAQACVHDAAALSDSRRTHRRPGPENRRDHHGPDGPDHPGKEPHGHDGNA